MEASADPVNNLHGVLLEAGPEGYTLRQLAHHYFTRYGRMDWQAFEAMVDVEIDRGLVGFTNHGRRLVAREFGRAKGEMMGRYDGEEYAYSRGSRRDCTKCTNSQVCTSHCPNAKEHSYLRGQRCDSCGTYFRGDSMG